MRMKMKLALKDVTGGKARSTLPCLGGRKLRLWHYCAVHPASLLTFQSLFTSEISFYLHSYLRGWGGMLGDRKQGKKK